MTKRQQHQNPNLKKKGAELASDKGTEQKPAEHWAMSAQEALRVNYLTHGFFHAVRKA